MKTKVLKVEHDREKQAKVIDLAATVIKQGGVVIFPTETAYAIGVDATRAECLKKLFDIKPDNAQGVPIVVSDLRTMTNYAQISGIAMHLAHSFMPGPLTLVVDQKKGAFPAEISKGGIAFRIPGNDFVRAFVSACDVPVTATAALSLEGKPTYQIQEILQALDGKVEMIIDHGNLPGSMPSTIFDVRGDPKLVRNGPISEKDVLAAVREFHEGGGSSSSGW